MTRFADFPSLTAAAGLLSALLLSSSCEAGGPKQSQLNVYAASSLTEAFIDIERVFEAANDDVDVILTFAGSQILRLQIEHGAPANLFASANPYHTRALIETSLLHDVRPFATNEIAVIVPLDNPANIESYADLTLATRIVIGTESVPIGRYTRAALHLSVPHLGADFAAIVLSRVVSLENNVRLVRAKVELGEADAGIVYRTDAQSSTRVRTITIPAELNVSAKYTLGIINVEPARHRDETDPAERFIAFVLSTQGQKLLSEHGFLSP